MSSRNYDGKNSKTGRRTGGWRLSTLKAVVACQDDSSAVVVGAPNATSVGTITPSTEIDMHELNQKEHERRIREHIANISNEMIIRFLRRSFFQALCDEDLVAAHYCYVATRDDFEQHFFIMLQQKIIQLRREENERQGQEGKESRSHLKRKGTGVESSRNVNPSSQMATGNPNIVCSGTDTTVDSDGEMNSANTNLGKKKSWPVGLLQQTMDICDPFTMDDYLDPYDDPYRPSEEAEIDVSENVNIEDGNPNVDVMNALFKELLSIPTGSEVLNSAMKQKTSTTSSSSPSMMTRSCLRKNRQRVLETDVSGDLAILNHGIDAAIVDGMVDPMQQQIDPLVVTTPLHECARLGHVELLKCMLQQCRRRRKFIDLDVRNGYGRTVLHNVAGGLIDIVEKVATSIDVDTGNIVRNVGIGAPQNRTRKGLAKDSDVENLLSTSDAMIPNNDVSVTQRISRIVNRSGRWLSLRNVKSKMNDDLATLQPSAVTRQRLHNFGKFLNHCRSRSSIPIARIARIETINILLSWRNEMTAATEPTDSEDEVHTEDEIVLADEKQKSFSPYEDDYGGDHVSTNAVDAIMNRTALHYAAELGRTDICKSILSAFYGTMLTIVDNAGRTPCELAALNNHSELASYLEARSLLYADPYGTEEELLSAISFAEMNHHDVAYYRYNLAAPYCCFETISREEAKHHREVLIQEATEQIDLHVAEFYKQRQCRLAKERKRTSHEGLDPPGHSDSTCAPDDSVLVSDPATTDSGQNESAPRNFFEIVSDVDDPLTGSNEIETVPPSSDDAIYSTAMEIGIHVGHVERLLSYHKWLVYDMMKALRHSPSVTFKNANVPIPQPPPVLPKDSKLDQSTQKYTCLICCDEFNKHSDQWKQMSGCGHGFCADCLVDYIAEHTNSSSTGFVIECPHHDCPELISPTVINDVVTKSVDTLDRLRRSAIDAFVVSSYDHTYCPYPGCGENKVIHTLYPMKCYPSNAPALRLIGGVCTNFLSSSSDHKESSDEPVVLTYESISDPRHYDLLDMVQPQLAHRFCFLCGETRIHWPITCSQLQEWRSAISEHVGEPNTNNEDDTSSNYNEVAQNIWMKVNTRPCPKCKAPIQKDEGCNHITCRNPHCKHQFCWICRADWSTHNSATGGNYRCNRWVEQPEHEAYDGETMIDDETRAMVLSVEETDPSRMAEVYGTARHESRVARQRSSETARFLHHYERWCGQANSSSLEHKMRLNLCERIAPVVRNAIEYGGGINIFGGKGISFLHAAFSELLECRSMLQHSYAFAFVYYKSNAIALQKSNEKVVFERIQSELELLTEQLSDVVARAHIRASETQILFLIKDVSGKRKEFTNFMFDVLRTVDIDGSMKMDPNLTSLPGHRPTSVRNGDYSSDDEDRGAAAIAIRQSLDTFDAATNRRFRQTMDDDDNELHDWACPGCTYMNAGSVRRCDMCDTRRTGA